MYYDMAKLLKISVASILAMELLGISNILIDFLVAGELPGLNLTLSPAVMMILLSIATTAVMFVILAKRLPAARRVKQRLSASIAEFMVLAYRRLA